MSRPILLMAAGVLFACEPSGQDVPMTDMGQPVDTLLVPYSYLSDASWLGGNRWAFVAPTERHAVMVDLDNDSVWVLGGPRPTQYQDPFGLFRSGDSLYVGDWGKRSLTVWGLDGQFARSIPVTSFVRGAFPQARDGQRRFYSQVYPPAGSDGSGNRDSAAILAMTPDLVKVDTVGRLAPLDIAEVFGDAGRRYEPRAMSGRDLWGVFEDGTLWIARVNQNRIDRRAPDGTWSRGRQLPDRVLTVLPEDREQFLLQFPVELRSTAEKTPFAIIKPPFESAFDGTGGKIWLVKSYSLLDSTRSAQVVSPEGRLIQQLEYRGFGRLIGTNGEMAVVAEPYEGGHRLLLFKVPPIGR